MAHWQLDPTQLLPLAALLLAYRLRSRTLARRGRPIARRRGMAFGAGIALAALSLASPLDWYGENRLLWVHMIQHLVLGDLAPLLAVTGLTGLTGPMVRPVLAAAPRGLRSLRVLAHPMVALPVWIVDFAGWHLPPLYDAALGHPAVHALEHVCFFLAGARCGRR